MHKFKYAGHEYPIPDVFTFAEARTVKRLTGMTLAEVDKQFAEDGTDPDCIFAYFVVSVQRGRPSITERELGQVSMADVELVLDEPPPLPEPKDEPDGGTSPPSKT